jgi:nucleoporin NUP42
MFKGKPVSYEVISKNDKKEVPVIKSFGGAVTKIWFPDGAPNFTRETEAADPRVYDDVTVQQQWAAFLQTGTFAGGLMPEVPPKRDFCSWDF